MHLSLDEFEIRPDQTTGFHGNRKCYNFKNSVATFSRLFLMGSFSYLQVMMTYMRAWMSSKFCQIRPLVSMATDRVIMAKTMSPLFLGFFFSSDPFHTCR